MSALAMVEPERPSFKKIDWMARDIIVERRPDGCIVMRARVQLNTPAPHIPSFLRKWAAERPDHVWLAQRRGPAQNWLKVTYAQAKQTVDSLTQALLDLSLPPETPVAILSANSIEHALFVMAAMQARLPAVPISPAYSLLSQDHAKLKMIFDLIRPGAVLVQDGAAFEKALSAVPLDGVSVFHVEHPPTHIASRSYADLAATPVTQAVEASVAAITHDTIGKLLFTSGSTGLPKAVINTQRMMCANMAMVQQARPRGPDQPPPVYLDWLPWNHTMGGNANFHLLLAEGGTYHIDDGRPPPGPFDKTLRNLREVSPTSISNVPVGYAALITALEGDDDLAQAFFARLTMLSYGGATLPDDLYTRMQALAVRWTGHRIAFVTGWGSTETSPTATSTYWNSESVGLIGLPYPGVELKMVPVGDKYELRLRAPIVMPGYYKQPELTASAFDEEGFYKIGDAGRFVDPSDPGKGLVFAGRVVEDFKLNSGTFVHVGPLRVASLAAASPLLQDAVVTGQDRPFVGLMAWLNLEACRKFAGLPQADVETLTRAPAIRAHIRHSLNAHNAKQTGSSFRIKRALLLREPPSIDGNELTDKGYINQRAVQERRADLVARLYADSPDDDIIALD